MEHRISCLGIVNIFYEFPVHIFHFISVNLVILFHVKFLFSTGMSLADVIPALPAT